MLRPIPVALASCTRFFEAMSAMRESFATLQALRVGATPSKDPSQRNSDCVTPPPWRTETSFDDLGIRSVRQENEQQEVSSGEHGEVESRRLSWPPSVKKVGI